MHNAQNHCSFKCCSVQYYIVFSCLVVGRLTVFQDYITKKGVSKPRCFKTPFIFNFLFTVLSPTICIGHKFSKKMASSHVAGQQNRALTRYTLFVVKELLKLPLTRRPQTECFCTRSPFLFAIFSYITYNAEPSPTALICGC